MTVRDSDTLKSYFNLSKVITPANYSDLVDTIFAQSTSGEIGEHIHDNRYLQLSIANVVSAIHTFNPSTYSSPFILGAYAQGQTVVGLKADQLNRNISVSGLGLSGGGILNSDRTISLASSSNPGASASILASAVDGTLSLLKINADIIGDRSGSNLTLAPTGDLIFNPTGKDVLPTTGYDLNLGSLSKKYLALHAAELWVGTLVAQDTLATIGGRVLVGPTTELTSDLPIGLVSAYMKHNNLAVDDVVYLEANGYVEFLRIAAGPTGTGPYLYVFTRNLDGSGENAWYAGDAVFNTGAPGDGFIDIYSTRGIKEASDVGPTIVGNVRITTTYNAWLEHWALGNLNGLYGYGTDIYGVGLGRYSAVTPYITIDSTNGVRIFSASYQRFTVSTAGVLTIRDSGGDAVFTFDSSAGAEFTKPLTLATTGGIYQGSGTFGTPTTGLKVWNDSGIGRIGGYNDGMLQWYCNTDGKLYVGGGSVVLDTNGIQIINQSPVVRFTVSNKTLGEMSYKYTYAGPISQTGNLTIEQGIAVNDTVVNGSFDTDLSGWTKTSETGVASSGHTLTQGHSKAGCLYVYLPYRDPFGGTSVYQSTNFITTGGSAGDTIIFKTWVKMTAGGSNGPTITLKIYFYDNANGLLGSVSEDTTEALTNTWLLARVQGVAPANTAKLKVEIGISKLTLPTADATIYIDDAVVVDYFGGYQSIVMHTAHTSGVKYVAFSDDARISGGLYVGDLVTNPDNGTVTAANWIKGAADGLSGGVFIGSDTQLYRSSANLLRTPDAFQADSWLSAGGDGSSNGVFIGTDTQLYRNAANVLRTPDSFTVDATMTLGSYQDIIEMAVPATPSSGYGRIFNAGAGYLKFINDNGLNVHLGEVTRSLPVGTGVLHGTTIVGWGTYSVDTWSHNDSVDHTVMWTYRLPAGWGGRTLNYSFLCGVATTGTGNVRWIFEVARLYDTGSLPTAAAASEYLEIAPPGTIGLLDYNTGSVSLSSFADGDTISIRFGRNGLHANDTFGNTVRTFGLYIWIV